MVILMRRCHSLLKVNSEKFKSLLSGYLIRKSSSSFCLNHASPLRWTPTKAKERCINGTSDLHLNCFSCTPLEDSGEIKTDDSRRIRDHFEKLLQDDEYHLKFARIMDIYDKLPEEVRPTDLSLTSIDYMIKMDKDSRIKAWLKSLRRRADRRAAFKLENKENTSEAKKINRWDVTGGPYGLPYDNEGNVKYALYHNNCVPGTRRSQTQLIQCQKIIHSYDDGGGTLILDMSFEKYMTLKEIAVLANEVNLIYNIISTMDCPPALYLCNLDESSYTLNRLKRYWREDLGYLRYTPKSYLDIFPKNKLVYLTPHTDTILEYNPDDIWIVGGMIDVGKNRPLSGVKAEKEGLRVGKLPQDLILLRSEGKSLHMSYIVGVMCDLIESRGKFNMVQALSDNIPLHKRKTVDESENQRENWKQKTAKRQIAIGERYNLTEEELESSRLFNFFWSK